MKFHIEYDDFGEYLEVLEEIDEWEMDLKKTEGSVRKTMKRLFLIVTAVMMIFGTTSYAAGTCAVKGCYKSTVNGGSHCKNHTCSKYNCKNFSADGTYCSDHQKKEDGKNTSSSGKTDSKTCIISGCNKSANGGSAYCYQHKCKHTGCKNYGIEDGYCASHAKKKDTTDSGKGNLGRSSSYSKQCIVSGCNNSRAGGSSYCSKHKCGQSGCKNKAGTSGYCDKHRQMANDPYDVYEYDDPEDFYYDWMEDFWDYEDAEDYWEDAWN